VDVSVKNRLAGCHAVVDANGEPVRLEFSDELGPDLSHQTPQGCLRFFGQLEQADDMPPWNDEGVAFRDRESVEDCHGDLVFQVDMQPQEVTEGTSALIHDDELP
jgi:hypothetical protein